MHADDGHALARAIDRQRPAAGARPAGRTAAGAATARRVLDAAVRVFAEYGYFGASVGRIAEAAGLSKPNLLYHFRTKEALYAAVLARTLDAWLDPLRELDEDADPEEALRTYVARKLAMSRDDPLASRLFATEILQGAPRLRGVLEGELRELVERKARILRLWMAQGRLAPVDPLHLVFVIWATTQHYADFAVQVEAVAGRGLDDPAFMAETVDAVAGVILRGVLPR
jgi:TetR/AcrR family transcriptional regulator